MGTPQLPSSLPPFIEQLKRTTVVRGVASSRVQLRTQSNLLKAMAASKRWQLTPFEYKIDFVLAPLLFGIALWSARISLAQIVLGALAWSFSEYVVHRFLFHRKFRKDHWAHHL
ncbi:MAG: hypothetical protein EOP18_10765, partial [Rhizobiaceae bacterium]